MIELLLNIEDQSDREFMLWLYEEFHRLMFSTAKEYSVDIQTQEDVVQESLEKLIKKTALLRTKVRPVQAAYIITTVRNTAISLLKKEQAACVLELEIDMADPYAPLPEEILLLKDRNARLSAVWSRLPAQDRFLLEGKYFLDSSDEELAACLHCKPSSIRMKLTRARRKALRLLNEQNEGIKL